MKFYFRLIFIAFLFASCHKKEKNTTSSELVMYQPSEMASLMNTMYYMNADIKKKILNNENIGSFPERYLTIHTAKLTDNNDRTSDFEKFSLKYIDNMKLLYKENPQNQKSNFNKAVQSCIACHQTSCRGPISRIKKLLIK
ncbi:hypothetical protein SAMN04489761_4219 [Tenacibaculum sp. MAR_2009_124]|uniref:hypothetical protein n=1 Tax=Tenacibaculum sp. MAR_2009_124 TaxID=1250059 RepID=UPI000899B0E2|nr:hypothetical protein [Tenacibaculum sp. MAR_2009_124]SED08385.1 hypothetical protein SAMN04489761_4219 [Tenacibaculum sp. MAR_2009_124]